jgi:alkylhydroperoxidase family enzyme
VTASHPGRRRPSAPRIPPRADLPAELRARVANPLDGQLTQLGATLAWHPELLRRFGELGRWMLEGEQLPLRARVITALRVGWRTRCLYEFAQNRRRAARAGLDPAALARLASPDPGEAWSAAERALIDAIDELCASDGIGDATWARAAAHFAPAALLELAMLAGFYRMLAGVINAAGIQPEPGLEGWPPGATPADG